MNPFEQDLAIGDTEVFAEFGVMAEVIEGITPESPPLVILDRRLEVVDEAEGGITMIALAARVLLSQWPSPSRGNVIRIGTRRYELGRLLADDGMVRQFELVAA